MQSMDHGPLYSPLARSLALDEPQARKKRIEQSGSDTSDLGPQRRRRRSSSSSSSAGDGVNCNSNRDDNFQVVTIQQVQIKTQHD